MTQDDGLKLEPKYRVSEVAKAVGKSVSYVSLVLSGKRNASTQMALDIERVTNGAYDAAALSPNVAIIRRAESQG
jgi:DNA-binding transcriptional regulator YdaS (Cro superfamily)